MTIRRLPTIGAAVVGVTLVLTACGGSSGNGAETTPAPNTTPWRTLAPVAGTDPSGSVPIEGGVISYKIKSGDYANAIAKRAGGGCSGTELLDFNPDVKVLIPGDALKIPANCLAAGVTEESLNSGEDFSSDDGSTDDQATDDQSTDDGESDTTVDRESLGTYKIVAGDYWFGIAKKVGCKYDELKAVNQSVRVLIPGRKLKVPAKCSPRKDGATATDDTDTTT